jgi:hypothetical protein
MFSIRYASCHAASSALPALMLRAGFADAMDCFRCYLLPLLLMRSRWRFARRYGHIRSRHFAALRASAVIRRDMIRQLLPPAIRYAAAMPCRRDVRAAFAIC